ncbi:MAG: leucine-rich repeat protein [Prevotella sp.]|nr:leucine-rich repeat protein [Prevotella sp.]
MKKITALLLVMMCALGAWAQTDKETPLTLEAKTDGTIMVTSPKDGMQYTLNDGAKTAVTTDAINVAVGDKVAFYGSGTAIPSYYGTMITGGTAECYVYGNVMSLVDETGFATATTLIENGAFYQLFYQNTKIYNHESKKVVLPATKLAEYCYDSMFSDCTGLTEAPELPATTLTANCYKGMFSGCTALTEAPKLPATTLEKECYSSIFMGCTALTAAPKLPATTLAEYCYNYMFYGCTKLTAAPELPATTLKKECYSGMFMGCKALTAAPVLPATELAGGCYDSMFFSCSNLSKVTCLATEISASYATSEWLYGVAATGTFYKAKDMEDWTSGTDGIPAGWEVEEYEPTAINNVNGDVNRNLNGTIKYFKGDKLVIETANGSEFDAAGAQTK